MVDPTVESDNKMVDSIVESDNKMVDSVVSHNTVEGMAETTNRKLMVRNRSNVMKFNN